MTKEDIFMIVLKDGWYTLDITRHKELKKACILYCEKILELHNLGLLKIKRVGTGTSEQSYSWISSVPIKIIYPDNEVIRIDAGDVREVLNKQYFIPIEDTFGHVFAEQTDED